MISATVQQTSSRSHEPTIEQTGQDHLSSFKARAPLWCHWPSHDVRKTRCLRQASGHHMRTRCGLAAARTPMPLLPKHKQRLSTPTLACHAKHIQRRCKEFCSCRSDRVYLRYLIDACGATRLRVYAHDKVPKLRPPQGCGSIALISNPQAPGEGSLWV